MRRLSNTVGAFSLLTDQSDRPVLGNGKRPNSQRMLILKTEYLSMAEVT